MHKMTAYLVTALAILMASVVVPQKAQALPGSDLEITYYDCSWNVVAWKYRSCGGSTTNTGNPAAAAYREVITESCNGGENTYAIEQLELGTGIWQPYTGGTSAYCACIARNEC